MTPLPQRLSIHLVQQLDLVLDSVRQPIDLIHHFLQHTTWAQGREHTRVKFLARTSG